MAALTPDPSPVTDSQGTPVSRSPAVLRGLLRPLGIAFRAAPNSAALAPPATQALDLSPAEINSWLDVPRIDPLRPAHRAPRFAHWIAGRIGIGIEIASTRAGDHSQTGFSRTTPHGPHTNTPLSSIPDSTIGAIPTTLRMTRAAQLRMTRRRIPITPLLIQTRALARRVSLRSRASPMKFRPGARRSSDPSTQDNPSRPRPPTSPLSP